MTIGRGGSHTTDRVVQHIWGLRYIDDLVFNRQDSNADGDYVDAGDFTHYALTDHQFSVIALIDSAANLIERVSYTPYGEARHHWMQDVDGDGDIDATDQSLTTAALNNRIYQGGYNVDADFNRDGLIDSSDTRQVGSGAFKGALPAGWISSLSVGNTIGFSGYVFNVEIDAGGLYTVRFRHFDPVWGRWVSRDPAGHQDSMSLYGYGWGSPLGMFDPFGLASDRDPWRVDPDDHGGPHIQKGNRRYRVKDLSPIPHKGVTPSPLSVKDLQEMLEDGVPQRLKSLGLDDSVVREVLEKLGLVGKLLKGKLAKKAAKELLEQIARKSPLLLLFILADYAEGGVEQAASNAIIPGDLIEELLEIAAESARNWMDERHYNVQRKRLRNAGFSEEEIDEMIEQLLFEEQIERLKEIGILLEECSE